MPWSNLVLWGKGPEILKELFRGEKVITKDEVHRDKNGDYQIKL